MELSTRVRKLTQKYGLDAEDVAFCDLVGAGWGRMAAAYYCYHLSYPDNGKVSEWLKGRIKVRPGINTMLMDIQEEQEREKKKLASLSNREKKEQEKLEKAKVLEAESLKTKQGMLDYLIELASTPGLDLKTKADLAKQITDLQNYKKEEVKEEDTRVHYFLPLTCSKCQLYVNSKNTRKDEMVQTE